MPRQFKEQGPQAIVLRSLLQGAPLPGGQHPVTLGDLPLARRSDGVVRMLTADLEPVTISYLSEEEAPKVALVAPEMASAELKTPSSALLRSKIIYSGPGDAKVWVEVCGLQEEALQVWESFVVSMTHGPSGWVIGGEPLRLAT